MKAVFGYQLAKAIQFCFWLLIVCLSLLLVYHIFSFYSFRSDLEFFDARKRNFDNPIWWIAVYLHVTGGLFCLLTGIPLFMPFVLRRYPSLHNLMGKTYVIAVLCAMVPAGIYLSFFSDATVCLGFWAETRFLLLGTALFYSTWKAYVLILRGERKAHCQWMIRSYALALVTLTFRSMVVINSGLLHIERTRTILFSLWASLLLNVLIAEVVIKCRRRAERDHLE